MSVSEAAHDAYQHLSSAMSALALSIDDDDHAGLSEITHIYGLVCESRQRIAAVLRTSADQIVRRNITREQVQYLESLVRESA